MLATVSAKISPLPKYIKHDCYTPDQDRKHGIREDQRENNKPLFPNPYLTSCEHISMSDTPTCPMSRCGNNSARVFVGAFCFRHALLTEALTFTKKCAEILLLLH